MLVALADKPPPARLAGSHWILRLLARPHNDLGKPLHGACSEDPSITGVGPVRLVPAPWLDGVLAKLIIQLPHHMRMLLKLLASLLVIVDV
jgi:hypothetical protein